MDDIERMCREAEIVRKHEAYSGAREYRATQAQLAMLVFLTQRAERERCAKMLRGDEDRAG